MKTILGREQTNAIKGFFILVVFVRHIYPYITAAGRDMGEWYDALGQMVDHWIGQLLVVMFLFYSGYGVMESIKRKGSSYVASIPKHRFLNTLLNFDVAVLCYVLLNIVLSIDKPWKEIIGAFTGWTSVGNSNWYIFVILICYLSTYLSFRKADNQRDIMHGRGKLLILICLAWIVLWRTKSGYWYNTILSYPAGVLFSIYRQHIEQKVMKRYWLITLATLAVFLILFRIGKDFASIRYNMLSVVFAAFVVLMTMKVRISNPMLMWCVRNLFPLYIYQRIAMITFATIGGGTMPSEYTTLYIIGCFIITLAITYLYKHIELKL